MTPDKFAEIRNKVLASVILTKREKDEWLALLPGMTENQTRELDRILSVTPAAPLPLTTLSVADLRKSASVFEFLSRVAARMRDAGLPEGERQFEQSPLHKAYVASGVQLMEGRKGELSKEEVEAISDFRTNLRKG